MCFTPFCNFTSLLLKIFLFVLSTCHCLQKTCGDVEKQLEEVNNEIAQSEKAITDGKSEITELEAAIKVMQERKDKVCIAVHFIIISVHVHYMYNALLSWKSLISNIDTKILINFFGDRADKKNISRKKQKIQVTAVGLTWFFCYYVNIL